MVYNARKLSLVKAPQSETQVLRIAFATNDKKHVNQHFGTSSMFALYELSEKYCQLIELVEYTNTQKGHNEQKLHQRIAALNGCQAMYCNAIGSSAIRQLLAKNIHPIKVEPEQAFTEILADIKQLLHEFIASNKEALNIGKKIASKAEHKINIHAQWVSKVLIANSRKQMNAVFPERRLTELLDEEW